MKAMLARACLVAAALALAACRGPADGFLFVTLDEPVGIDARHLQVVISTQNEAGPARADTVRFTDTKSHPVLTKPTFGLNIPGDIGTVSLLVHAYASSDEAMEVATGGASGIIVRAGQRTDVTIHLSGATVSPQPDGSADGGPDGGEPAPPDATGADGPNDVGGGGAAGDGGAPDSPRDMGVMDVPVETAPEAPMDVPPEVQLPPPDLNTKLVAWWKMDEEMGVIAHDSSKNGNDAMLNNLFDGVAWPAGHLGSCFRPGGSGWLSTKDSPSFNTITDEISVSVWINHQNLQTGRRTILQWPRVVGLTDELWLGLFNNQLEISVGLSPTFVAKDPIPELNWTHVAVTFSPTSLKMYVNGALVVSDNMPQYFITKQQSRWFDVAASCHDADPSVVQDVSSYMLIDDLMIYSRALALQDVLALANNMRPTP